LHGVRKSLLEVAHHLSAFATDSATADEDVPSIAQAHPQLFHSNAIRLMQRARLHESLAKAWMTTLGHQKGKQSLHFVVFSTLKDSENPCVETVVCFVSFSCRLLI
jgi:hypothetical protein